MKITDMPSRVSRAKDLEELDRLLRREHGGGLVEDEDVRSAVEGLQDLHPLLLADADVLHPSVGVDGEAERLRELRDPLPRFAVVEDDAAGRGLGREHDVLRHRHHGDEHEVLVHHADPVPDRVLRGVERHGLAADKDLALVVPVEAVEDVHQRRLAGAVLPQQRVHLPAAEVEVDVVVGDDAREALRDPAELEDPVLVRHRWES